MPKLNIILAFVMLTAKGWRRALTTPQNGGILQLSKVMLTREGLLDIPTMHLA